VDRPAQQVLGARRDQRALREIQVRLDRLGTQETPEIEERLVRLVRRVRRATQVQLEVLERRVTLDLREIAESLVRLGTQDLPEIVERLEPQDLRAIRVVLDQQGRRATQDPQDL